MAEDVTPAILCRDARKRKRLFESKDHIWFIEKGML